MPEQNNNLIDKIISLTKQRGFIFPGSELYGGLANAWDFGPLGVELKNNIKKHWWKTFVQERLDIIGQDGAIILNTKAWEASGHVAGFNDIMLECKKCHNRFRAEELITDELVFQKTMKHFEDLKNDSDRNDWTQESFPKCPICSSEKKWTVPVRFNTMFKTFIGTKEDPAGTVYLRPETAQAIFINFPTLVQSARMKLPFGVAQIGKAFRNEITPGNFIFRTREFEQMEIEYFIKPKEKWEKYFDLWLEDMKKWMSAVGIDKNKLHYLDVPEGDRAHYSKKTVDIEFDFPFERKELFGLAYRSDFDLKCHKVDYIDPETKEKYIPHVIEPSLGVERGLLAILVSAYHEEEAPTADGKTEKRVVLKLKKDLAPFKVAVLPLSKKPELEKVAKKIWSGLSQEFMTDYDVTGSIGLRYRRQDEIGTPYCVTVDFETLNDEAVTVRDRDTMKQERVGMESLIEYLAKKLKA